MVIGTLLVNAGRRRYSIVRPVVRLLILLMLAATASSARRERLVLKLTQIDLPGAPASVLPMDLDRDGVGDLVIVVAYTEWDQMAIEESTEMDEVEGLIEMMTIVPSLADRRELYLYLGRGEGGFERVGDATPLDPSVVTLAAGPPGEPLIALTADGIAGVRMREESPELDFVPLVSVRSVLSQTGALLPDLGLARDLDGDGWIDVLVPQVNGLVIYRGNATGIEIEPSARVSLPPRTQYQSRALSRHYPLPRIEDVDGDQLPDLVFRHPSGNWRRFWVARSRGGGTFAPLAELGEGVEEDGRFGPPSEGNDSVGNELSGDSEPEDRVVYFGDLNGEGLAEYVLLEELNDEDAGWRKGLKQAKRPPVRFHVYPSEPNLTLGSQSLTSFSATGYAFEGEGEVQLPGGFQDLDGDGRKDLVTITLDFSLLQALRVLATRSISIGLDFHVWCQGADGGFHAVRGLNLSGKFKLRLDDLRLGQLSQFAGDFDGDGRFDFVQMGRHKNVSIHLGQQGCRYSATPDLGLELANEPKNLALVRVGDYDGDELADLVIVQPQALKGNGATSPVRLDLYLSGGGE